MDHPREQFDELLGGTEQLPMTVSLLKFANARSQEILALTEAVEDPRNNHLAFQNMPRHLRRRAMSHKPKRMPRRLREVHISQMQKSGGLISERKRSSRKYRRRPSNLLQEYNRRQRTHVWLETHIWHAKRFHMTSQWGYKLPESPNNKSFRACYRATARHCLIQDMSYLNCIELQGKEEELLRGLSQLTTPDCGLTFAARAFSAGNREGSVSVFRRGTYPFQAIGKVTFMWRPEMLREKRTLWIWCHPAFYTEFLQELIAVFGLEIQEMDVERTKKINGTVKKNQKNVESVKLKRKNLGNLLKYLSKTVEMTLLKDTLNRFRLTGPLAQVVLAEALRFVDIDQFVKKENVSMDVDSEESHRSDWMSYFNEEGALKCLHQQRTFWDQVLKNVNSADELSPKMIVSAVVMDPRLTMPNTRTKAVNDDVCSPQAELPEGLSAASALWNATLRNAVTHSKMAVAELNRLRSRALVPGLVTQEWLGRENVSHVPLLLVQRPGVQGFGSGWDLIVPAGWGVPVWLGLVYRGARVGGLRETKHLGLEMCQGPILQPDTAAGRELAQNRKTSGLEKHFRLPPDKRVNYVKLGVSAPFHCPWEQLLQDWTPGNASRDFYVIRNRHQLSYLESLTRKKPEPKVPFSENDKQCGLVQVELEMCGRGTVGEFSMICKLEKKDLKLARDKSGRGPLEPSHEDVNEEARKSLRETHLTKLKRLRKKRVKARRELEEQGVFKVKEKFFKSPTEGIVNEQAEVMKELWLPSEVKEVKGSCSRDILGFVTFGDYSFSRSKCIGYGFVALAPLLSVLGKQQGQVLVRNVTSTQYNFAKLKVSNHN